jgi:hypothetical protein
MQQGATEQRRAGASSRRRRVTSSIPNLPIEKVLFHYPDPKISRRARTACPNRLPGRPGTTTEHMVTKWNFVPQGLQTVGKAVE